MVLINTKGVGGRKKLPENEKKLQRTVFLKPHLLEWLLEQGKGNLGFGIELVAKRSGYKEAEQEDSSKQVKPHRRLSVEAKPSMCVLEVA
jgi:hypothetical protein